MKLQGLTDTGSACQGDPRVVSGPARPDVVVVGAGPAGATAARVLALGGARVRLLDRCRFPRDKACGGAISIRALDRFPHLRAALPRISTRLISRLHLEAPAGGTITFEAPEPAALMVRRLEFDELLVRLAQDAGAELIEGAEITQASSTGECVQLVTRGGQVVRAPIVVAADGVNSVVARRLGFGRGWPASSLALDMTEEIPVDALRCRDPDSLWVSYGHSGGAGYAYVFPKADHVSVGIGYLLPFYRAQVGESPRRLRQQLVSTLCGRGVLEGTSRPARITGALIPVGGPRKETARARVLLAGDAGGFVNGFYAEGIYYAMVTGDLAAKAVLAGTPERYERAWRREIGAELRDSVLIQRHLFGDIRRIDGMVEGARIYPNLAKGFIEYVMGRLPYKLARQRLVLRLPLIAARLALAAVKFGPPPVRSALRADGRDV
jgi:geranylgeranyl reductase family protein